MITSALAVGLLHRVQMVKRNMCGIAPRVFLLAKVFFKLICISNGELLFCLVVFSLDVLLQRYKKRGEKAMTLESPSE